MFQVSFFKLTSISFVLRTNTGQFSGLFVSSFGVQLPWWRSVLFSHPFCTCWSWLLSSWRRWNLFFLLPFLFFFVWIFLNDVVNLADRSAFSFFVIDVWEFLKFVIKYFIEIRFCLEEQCFISRVRSTYLFCTTSVYLFWFCTCCRSFSLLGLIRTRIRGECCVAWFHLF